MLRKLTYEHSQSKGKHEWDESKSPKRKGPQASGQGLPLVAGARGSLGVLDTQLEEIILYSNTFSFVFEVSLGEFQIKVLCL